MIIRNWINSKIGSYIKFIFYNTLCKWYIILCGTHDNRNTVHRLSLCLIFKNEAPFLKEWIDYHCSIGVDHFYLYNNNSDDNYLDILKPYITNNIVTLIDFPYEQAQMKAYKDCFERFRTYTKWLCFLDADEFICPKYETDLNEWVSKYDKYPAVMIHWLMFGTGGQMKHDYTRNVIEQYYSCQQYFYPFGKSIVNTRYDIALYNWHTHHHVYMYYKFLGIRSILPAINQFSTITPVNFIWKKQNERVDESNIQINHYYTKSWDICESKSQKTDVYYAKNPKIGYFKFFQIDTKCIRRNYVIQRFFVHLKLYQTNKR